MRRFLMFVLVGVCWAGVARADVPGTVGYNGVLFTCQAGEAGCNGYSLSNASLTVSLWDDATSTEATHEVWADTFVVTSDSGYFHVDLGSREAAARGRVRRSAVAGGAGRQ